ncbi:group 1 truncated hemoglobin [Myxococcota bacterium]|nr:group 1 truncated hemoglobin [Myxococcota bacterium]
MSGPSDLERLGGETAARAIISDFIARVARDFVIGYLFAGRDLERIVLHETAMAVAMLGGPVAYTGRPLGAVHQPLKINAGHFRRRLAFLERTLEAHGVPEDIAARWIEHNRRLERLIVDGTDCAPDEPPPSLAPPPLPDEDDAAEPITTPAGERPSRQVDDLDDWDEDLLQDTEEEPLEDEGPPHPDEGWDEIDLLEDPDFNREHDPEGWAVEGPEVDDERWDEDELLERDGAAEPGWDDEDDEPPRRSR